MPEVVWSVDHRTEGDGDTVALDRVAGFESESLEPLSDVGATTSLASGGLGKGASGIGVALVLEVAEHALNDTTSLVGIGLALREVIKRVSRRRGQGPDRADAGALAYLSAAEATTIHSDAGSWRHSRTVGLTADGSVGTDMRDIWASCFLNESAGLVLVVFMSPTTRVLGIIQVAAEWTYEGSGHIRSDDELAALLRPLS